MDELTKKTKPRYGFNRIWLIIGALTLGLGGQTLMAQWTKPWTLGPGLFLLGVSIWIFLRETPVRWVEKEKPSIFPWGEWALVLFLLALAAFYRWYRLNEIPAGIFPDIASLACGSLRILHEGWRPFYEIYNLGVWEQPICYQLAGWFWLFGATRISLFSFSALVSMGALLLAYFLFRQLAGRRTALVALVFFGVMRWYLTYSRCAHPAFEVPFYLCGTVVSWLYALRTKKWWAWLASALFLGTGFHSYQALKILPLLVGVLAVYEWNSRAGGKKVLGKAYLYYFSLCVLFTAPVWSYMFAHASLGRREQSLWIGTRLQSEGWEGLLVHLKDFLLMFFRNGDPWPVYGWPGHAIFPLLDVVTGFFFILGFFQALRSWRDRSSFYGLCGLVVTSLTGILTVESKNASHPIGMTPFIAFLAARGFISVWDWSKNVDPFIRRFSYVGLPLLLVAAAWLNFHVYFQRQMGDPVTWQIYSADTTAVGERIARLGADARVFLSSRFYRSYTVDFLNFHRRLELKRLDPENFFLCPPRGEHELFFALDSGKTGVLQMLLKEFPGGTEETFELAKGWPLAYFYRVSAGTKNQTVKFGGIRGIYRLSEDWNSTPAFTRKDPVLNFTFRNDFGVTNFPPMSVRWVGRFPAETKGLYSFLTLTTDFSQVFVDNRPVVSGGETKEGEIYLAPGWHRIRVDFQKVRGKDTAFNLLWMTPETKKYQVVPFWEFNSSK